MINMDRIWELKAETSEMAAMWACGLEGVVGHVTGLDLGLRDAVYALLHPPPSTCSQASGVSDEDRMMVIMDVRAGRLTIEQAEAKLKELEEQTALDASINEITHLIPSAVDGFEQDDRWDNPAPNDGFDQDDDVRMDGGAAVAAAMGGQVDVAPLTADDPYAVGYVGGGSAPATPAEPEAAAWVDEFTVVRGSPTAEWTEGVRGSPTPTSPTPITSTSAPALVAQPSAPALVAQPSAPAPTPPQPTAPAPTPTPTPTQAATELSTEPVEQITAADLSIDATQSSTGIGTETTTTNMPPPTKTAFTGLGDYVESLGQPMSGAGEGADFNTMLEVALDAQSTAAEAGSADVVGIRTSMLGTSSDIYAEMTADAPAPADTAASAAAEEAELLSKIASLKEEMGGADQGEHTVTSSPASVPGGLKAMLKARREAKAATDAGAAAENSAITPTTTTTTTNTPTTTTLRESPETAEEMYVRDGVPRDDAAVAAAGDPNTSAAISAVQAKVACSS
jgi:hypothetical protein